MARGTAGTARHAAFAAAVPARALRCAAQPAAVPEARLEDEPRAHVARSAGPARARAAAGRDAVRRQADHRRGGAPRAGGGPGEADWLASGRLAPLGWLLLLEFGLAVCADVLGRIVSLVDSLLGEQFVNATSVRLMEHAASLDLEDFEDSELQDRLDRARRQTMGRSNLMSQLFGQAQDVVTIASFAAGLVVYAPVADPAAARRARPRLPRRSALQRPELLAQLRAHGRAAGARLRAPGRRQRRDGEGSEDLRPEPVPDRALPHARRRASTRPTAGWRSGARAGAAR